MLAGNLNYWQTNQRSLPKPSLELQIDYSDFQLPYELWSRVVYEELGGVSHFLHSVNEFYSFNDLA